jgi:16S rRNA (cytosine967-C5)-methyltransferase
MHRSAEPAGLGARQAALKLLMGVLWRARTLDEGLEAALAPLKRPADRGLARAISAATLRHLVDLDAAIDAMTARPLPDDARARMVLRLALAQAWVLGTPAHAVVSTALPLVEGGPRRLVHGVLSRLLKGPARLPQPPTLPGSVRERWSATYPEDVTAIATVLSSEAPLDLALRDPATTEHWAAALGATSWQPGHLRLVPNAAIEALPGFDEGAWWVQDAAAQLPARVLAPRQGESVLDLCAAPGGKTLQLAAAGAAVTAVDRSGARLERVQANLARTRLSATIIEADLLSWQPPAPASAILLDAPCSATGTARRHPDVLHRHAQLDLSETTALQSRLLDRAADWLTPGGRLVYAVCSLEPEEGETQITALLARRSDLRLVAPGAEALGPFADSLCAEGWVRTLPSLRAEAGGVDGFFIACLQRLG